MEQESVLARQATLERSVTLASVLASTTRLLAAAKVGMSCTVHECFVSLCSISQALHTSYTSNTMHVCARTSSQWWNASIEPCLTHTHSVDCHRQCEPRPVYRLLWTANKQCIAAIVSWPCAKQHTGRIKNGLEHD